MTNNRNNNTTQGWNYISAIFSVFRLNLESDLKTSHISPKYIYRGITKRYFTESNELASIIANIQDKDYVGNNNCPKPKIETQKIIKDGLNEATKILKSTNEQPLSAVHKPRESKEQWELRIKEEEVYKKLYKELHVLADVNDPEYQLCNNENTESVNNQLEIPLDNYIKYLKSISESEFHTFTAPEQIRSGASVRLRDTDAKYYTVSDYIRYNKNLVASFKSFNPTYKNYLDLEILAEIQHKGGGTCLVDFSTNFLTSLWFACNNDFQDFGYLFCYDVNKDALLKDNITHCTGNRVGEPLEDLLLKTRKTKMYAGGNKFRFWLWKPDNINGRIARQDSVFVFGLEKFFIKKHEVTIIPIPPQWKKSILMTLKTFFGITSETVYPDADGFASSNSKIAKISNDTFYFNPDVQINLPELKTNLEQSDFDILQRGMSCLLKGEYNIALDYFLKFSIEKSELFEKLQESNLAQIHLDRSPLPSLYLVKLEVYYSIGFCYKKLDNYWAAHEYLFKSFRLCSAILTGIVLDENLEIHDKNTEIPLKKIFQEDKLCEIARTKLIKIIDDFMDVLYYTKNYTQARILISFLRANKFTFDLTEWRIIECINLYVEILDTIQSESRSATPESACAINMKLPKEKKWSSNLFETALYRYLRVITIAISHPDSLMKKATDKYKYNKAIEDFLDCTSDKNIPNFAIDYVNWKFTDLTNLINEFYCGDEYKRLRQIVSEYTYRMDCLQRSIQSRINVN